MNDAVTDGADLAHALDNAVFGAGELVENGSNGLGVGGQGDVLIELRLAVLGLVLQMAVDANAFAKTLGKKRFGLHVQKLILQGGGACVDDKNFHGTVLSYCKI